MSYARLRKADCKVSTNIKGLIFDAGQQYKVVKNGDSYYVQEKGSKKVNDGMWLKENVFLSYFDLIEMKLYRNAKV